VKIAPTSSLIKGLEDACAAWKLDPSEHELRYKGKAVDLSMALRMAGFPHGTKLELVKISKRAIMNKAEVSIAVELTGPIMSGQLDSTAASRRLLPAKLPTTATLWEVLEHFEQKSKVKITQWVGVPPPELNKLYEVHIHVPGYMQPVVTFMNRRIDNNDELKSTTLAQLGIGGGSGLLRVSHQYVAPETDKKSNLEVISNFHQTFQQRSQELLSPSQSSTTSQVTEKKFALPSDRDMRLFLAPEGVTDIKSIDVPDEFYDITHRDSVIYAKAIKIAASVDMLKHPVDASSLKAKDVKLARLRIRLLPRLYLEGKFLPNETVSDVRQFVCDVLENSHLDFSLFVTPPRQVLNRPEATLLRLGLVPSALVHFSLADSTALQNIECDGKGLIKPTLLDKVLAIQPATNKPPSQEPDCAP